MNSCWFNKTKLSNVQITSRSYCYKRTTTDVAIDSGGHQRCYREESKGKMEKWLLLKKKTMKEVKKQRNFIRRGRERSKKNKSKFSFTDQNSTIKSLVWRSTNSYVFLGPNNEHIKNKEKKKASCPTWTYALNLSTYYLIAVEWPLVHKSRLL